MVHFIDEISVSNRIENVVYMILYNPNVPLLILKLPGNLGIFDLDALVSVNYIVIQLDTCVGVQ